MAKEKLVETQHDLSSSQVSSQQSMTAIKNSSPLATRDNLPQATKLASPTKREQSKHPSRTLKEHNVSAQFTELQQAQQSIRQEQPATSANMDKLKLSKRKAVELLRVKGIKFKTKEQERLKNGQSEVEEELVLCECGDRDEDGDMVTFLSLIVLP